ncbi:MAG: hypothetical protein HY695_12955 [Deltaproteobacteria bacterium]|nr:hypothetical protein [Deltaproteobacteria bacterium]
MPRFAEVFKNSGVDEPEQWMMVPEEDFNVVNLVDGAHLTLNFDKARLKVEEFKGPRPALRTFRITGKAYGYTVIKAKNHRGKTEATLGVSVKRKLLLPTAFHLVKHADAAKKISTTVTNSQLDDIVARANGILVPQANVDISKESARWLKVNLETVQYSPFTGGTMKSNWEELVKNRDPHTAVNVFFVHTLKTQMEKAPPRDSQGLTVGYNIAVSDTGHGNTQLFGRTLAHEVLHWLGLDAATYHFTGPKDSIMQDAAGERLIKAYVEVANP